MLKVIIIGSGVAGLEAATQLRALKPDAEVAIYTRELVPPYRRPALSGMVAGSPSVTQFYLKSDNFYQEKNIQLKLGQVVSSIQPMERTITLSGGETIGFDKLLLATGSYCFRPPVPGINGSNVLTLREYADLTAIEHKLQSGIRKIAVIGGGPLGLELAESLIARGCEVTVIEGDPALLPRNLDTEAASGVRAKLTDIPGLTLRFGSRVQEIQPDGVIAGNDKILAELVMVSAGTRGNLALATDAGIHCNRGIVVDSSMRTSASDIYAAGDCAEVNGICYGLFNSAKTMGQTAGKVIAGEEAEFLPEAYPARISVFGMKIFSAGKLESPNTETNGEVASGNFRKVFRDASGRLIGCILIGDLRESLKLQAEINATK